MQNRPEDLSCWRWQANVLPEDRLPFFDEKTQESAVRNLPAAHIFSARQAAGRRRISNA